MQKRLTAATRSRMLRGRKSGAGGFPAVATHMASTIHLVSGPFLLCVMWFHIEAVLYSDRFLSWAENPAPLFHSEGSNSTVHTIS